MSFLKSVFSVSALTLVNRATGYIRDLLMVNLLGANAVTDAIVIAIKIPSFFRRIFAEGAFHVSFLPAYTHTQKSKVFAGMALSLLLGVLGCLVLGAELYYAPLSEMILKQAHPVTLGYVQQFGPIVFPYIFFISVVSFFGSILNAHGRFSAFAISQAIGNMTVIVFVWTLAGFTTQTGHLFAWGVLLSGIIQCLFILWSCWKKGLLIALKWPQWTPDISRFAKRFFPGMLSVSAGQVNVILVPLFLAARLPVGSLSYLQYADRLTQLPLSIIGIALSSVLLPMIGEKMQQQDTQGTNHMLSQALRFAWMVILPCFILLGCCAFPLINTMFGSSKLTPDQQHTIAQTVQLYAIGGPAYIFIKIFNARFFAARDMGSPLIGGVIGGIADIVLALLLVDSLKHLALAIAASLSSWCNVAFLMYRLVKRDGWVFEKSLRQFYGKAFLAACFSALSVLGVQIWLGSVAMLDLHFKIGYIVILFCVCSMTFAAGLWQLGLFTAENFRNIQDKITTYFRRQKP